VGPVQLDTKQVPEQSGAVPGGVLFQTVFYAWLRSYLGCGPYPSANIKRQVVEDAN